MSEPARPDFYISADVETDGPVPGPFSLLSFGLAAIGRYDGQHFERLPVREHTFYAELRPISQEFDPDALAVNGLHRDHLVAHGADPSRAMSDAAKWVRSISRGHRPILVAYPVAFDWGFLYWYFERFAEGDSPFGHSSCLDIRTQYQTLAGTVFDQSGKTAMPSFLQPSSPHTHNALDDAIEQGELFANLLEWATRRRSGGGREDRPGDSEPSWLAARSLRIA